MILDLKDLLKTPGSRVSYEVDCACPDNEGAVLLSPVTGVVTASNSRRHLVIAGKVHAVVAAECSRCLAAIELPIDVELEAACEIEYSESGALARLVPEDDESALLFGSSNVDIGELARQEIVLQIPLQPICDPDCRGICANCGANLNVEECRCTSDNGDPRLMVLRSLLDNREKVS